MLANRVELVSPPRDQFVGIALVAGVPHDLVAWSLKDVMQGQRQFDNAEVSAEVAAKRGNDLDDPLADLPRDLRQLPPVEFPEVVGSVE